MPIEETTWDVVVSPDLQLRHDEQLRNALARVITERLPQHKKLLRVVAWSSNAGGLFAAESGVRRYAVAYEVQLAA